MDTPAPPRGRSLWSWAIAALLLLEVVATGLDLASGSHDRLHWEEAINARAGVLFACGHLDRIWNLQYQPFCGGCTADALLGAGLFSVLAPTVQTFKSIPAAFHVALLAAGAGLAWRAAGGRGALVFLGLLLGTPAVFRKLGLIAWGNHAESMVFPVLAAWLLSRPGASRHSARWAALAGLVAGIGAWYCYTAAHALPVLLALALWRPRGWRAGAAFLGGVAVGMVPWWAYLVRQPALLETLAPPATAHLLPRPAEVFTYFAGPALVRDLWHGVGSRGWGAVVGGTYWYGLWALALLGLVAVARAALARDARGGIPGADPTAARAALTYGPLALGALLAAYLWRHGAWYGPGGHLSTNFLGLRHLSPLLPTLALCAAATQAPGTWRPVRAGALVLAVVLGAGGFGLRTLEWRGQPDHWTGRSVCERDTPAGPPAFPEAAEALTAHLATDPGEPLLCRRDHLIELAGSTCARDVVPPLAADALAAATSRVEAESFLDPCLQQAWGGRLRAEGGCSATSWAELLEATCARIGAGCGPWRAEVAGALLRSAPRECFAAMDPGSLGHDPALRAAWCRLRGERAAVRSVEAGGAALPPAAPPACTGEETWAWGVGWAWAKWFGCDDDATAAWERAGGAELGPSAEEGRAAACAIYAPTTLRP